MKRVLIFLFLLVPLNLYSTGLMKMSIDEVVKKAEVGFEGVCVSSNSYHKLLKGYTKPIVVTDYKFKVTKWIKKPVTQEDDKYFSFTQRGIPLENSIKTKIYGGSWFPYFIKNKTYLVFLRHTPEGLTMPVGTILGMSEIVENADGIKTVKNHYMKSLIKKSAISSTKSLSVDVSNNGEMNYDLFLKAVENSNIKNDQPTSGQEVTTTGKEKVGNAVKNIKANEGETKALENK